MKTLIAYLLLFLSCVFVWAYFEVETAKSVHSQLQELQSNTQVLEGTLTGQDVQPAKAFSYREFKALTK